MQFKKDIAQEFLSKNTSPWLRFVLEVLDAYAHNVFGKQLVVTDILRDPLVQLQWCKAGGYKSGFRHCIGEAADIRSYNLTEDERGKLLVFSADILPRFCRLDYHVKGSAPHFHVQMVNECRDNAKLMAMLKNNDAEGWFAG